MRSALLPPRCSRALRCGVFSNEAGLGTSAMAHSASSHTDGVQQGLFGIFEVFADTVVICTLTVLSLLCSGVDIEYGKGASAELVSSAFATPLRQICGYSVGGYDVPVRIVKRYRMGLLRNRFLRLSFRENGQKTVCYSLSARLYSRRSY